ncbi:proteasome subunit beta [Candidatus Woesearchaeota archaeon CG_4_10_14_0_2_um_filter_57_5]|nr:MAG: hypothetical protein AUJ68_02500 [Candidatus Woesearchaeota archaeon CG1_02_57_44]PIN69055.1 MAG: proteasome subunit beta [Candidatus Woesearchaeota archaeon CG11_big_fil_rev_8_21_14_0_20_57_5]PIZ53361.1 MAG: proteasome subunit beta [Candidatus Woesearchaeota archaeon CG_4_10_14_0_2_um_filter_57_5]
MDNVESNVLKTGTTTVGIVCKDGIILAADRRATAGTLIASKKTEKVHAIADNIAVTMAGTASDAQMLIKLVKSELALNRIRLDREVSVKEAANLLSRMVYYNIRRMSLIPGISHFLMGGKDTDGFHLYDIFADGSIQLIDDFIGSGSGSVMAYGVMETLYKPDMTSDEGLKLALKCINAAIQRDAASGNGLDVVLVNKDGVKKIFEKDLTVTV